MQQIFESDAKAFVNVASHPLRKLALASLKKERVQKLRMQSRIRTCTLLLLECLSLIALDEVGSASHEREVKANA